TDNPLWGCRRISGELKKLNIDIHDTTVNKIIQTFRKQGKIQPNGSWKKFLKSNWDSLFGMDFMTIDTLLGKRFYLFIILELKSRKIVRYDLTEYPTREFVKQRIELFSEEQPSKKTLIYDNHQRPHQGINRIPDGEINKAIGNIKKERILGGLHHHYYRSSA
ncbi:MAG TPA: hypothetical protein DCO79_05090, partial [Spirochaeta sp.]|nr:hypothetical protein [Spirochaeta sp.]